MCDFRSWFLVGTLVFLACGKTDKTECKKDTDCKGDRICEKGFCVEPRLRPVPPQDDPPPDPDPDPLPAMPRIPQLPAMPSLPSLSVPGLSFSGSGLNLQFTVQAGKDEHTIELVPASSGPRLRWCVNKKCEDLDPSSPGDLQRLFDRLASTAGSNDPQLREVLRMFKDLSALVNASGGLAGMPPASGRGSGSPFVNTPTGPQHAGVFRTCEEILDAGSQAEGAQADVEELVPTIVSSDQVTLKAPGGVLVELLVPEKLQGLTPSLAKTQNAVSVRFKILRVANKYIKGELQTVHGQ